MVSEEIVKSFNSWDWGLVSKAMHSIGTQLNARTWRMLKGEVISKAIEKASNYEAQYVDQEGYDFVWRGLRVELKSEQKMFKKETTADIQLKNTRGQMQVFKKTFDILLLVQSKVPFMAAIVEWELVNEHHRPDGDQIKAKIPFEDIEMVHKGEVIDWSEIEVVDLVGQFNTAIDRWLEEI